MDLEDAKKRLTFKDVSVRCRCVTKLIDIISKKAAKTKPISSSSLQVPELNLLFEVCGHDCAITSAIACDSIVYLVSSGELDLEHAVTKLVNIFSSAKNSCAIISALTKMLVQVSTKDHAKESPYSLQYPKHPLIAVLESKPSVWPVVLENIIQTVVKNASSQAFTVMEPVITYVLLNPCDVPDHALLRSSLLDKLTLGIKVNPNEIVKYVFQILPWFQVYNFRQIVDMSHVLSQLSKIILRLPVDDEKFAVMEKFFFVCTVFCSQCLQNDFEPSAILEIMKSLSVHFTTGKGLTIYLIASLTLISVLLGRTSGFCAKELLNIGHLLFKERCHSKMIAAMTMVPVVQVLSEPKILSFSHDESSRSLLTFLLKRLEDCVNMPCDKATRSLSDVPDYTLFEEFTSCASDSILCARVALFLDSASSKTKILWLNYVKDSVAKGAEVSDFLFNLIIGLFFSPYENRELFSLCLDTFETVSMKENTMSARMSALLLYKLTCEVDPERQMLVLECLSKTAYHKYAVPPVLNVLKMMADHQDLKAQAMYLMLQLFKKQERCFPILQKLLAISDSTISSHSGVCEVAIAQAAVIKELCIEKPEVYGGQSLKDLSSIINLPNSEANTPAVVLALEGVIHLCKSEVIELRSVWKNLSPKLCKDKRAPILVRMCRLISLAPSLQVKSFEYEKFMKDAAAFLWRLISSSASPPSVVGAAYDALSGYPIDYYDLKQLPVAAKTNLKLPSSMAATPFEMGKLPEDVLTYIPGYCFIDLLKSITDSFVLEGYEKLLQSLVREEVLELPRGVYTRRKLIAKKKNPDDVLLNVPRILCSLFESKKLAVVQKNLAVGILLSYEAPIEVNKEGQPVKRSLALQTRLYEQVLNVLLNEMNLDCNDWQRCLLLPQAWRSFMERAFFACEEGRRAELDLQRSQGHLSGSTDEISTTYDTAWLWIRDRFLELIKIASKNTSNSLANSIFAVAGLMRAASKFYDGLESEAKELADNCEKHPKQKTFNLICTESILCAFDPERKPEKKVFSWLLTHMPKQSSSAGAVVRGCAAAALHLLLPIIKTEFSEEMPKIFSTFSQNLSKSNPGTLSLYSGIGLGLFIKSICQDASVAGTSDQINAVLEVVESLDAGCKIEEFVRGKLIALTLAVSGMCQNGNPVFLPFIQNISESVQTRLKAEDVNSMLYEFVSICSSSIVVSAASANVLSIQTVKGIIAWFTDRRKIMPQCSSTAVSLGILVDALLRLGDSRIIEMSEQLRSVWLGTLATEREPTLHRIAALNGLCALFSAGRSLVKISSDLAAGSTTAGLKDLIQLMLQLLNATRDQSLQSICCWELGRMFSIHSGQQDDSSTLPLNYSYLSEKSILKHVVELIQENLPNNHRTDHALSCLKTLSQSFQRPLPPINWVTFLTPFLQDGNDAEVMELCLKTVVNQMASSPSAVAMMSSFATPPLLHSLPVNCQLLLMKNVPLLSTHLPIVKLRLFLEAAASEPTIAGKVKGESIFHVIQGILECLKVEKSNQGVVTLLLDVLKETLLNLALSETFLKRRLPLVCELLTQWPEKYQVVFLQKLQDGDSLCLSMFILCYFIKMGKRPLTSLRPTIETAKHEPKKSKEMVLSALLDCFVCGASQTESDVSNPEKCIAFLSETIGWMNVLTDKSAKFQLSNINEIAMFLLDICVTVIIGSAGFHVSYTILPEGYVNHEILIQRLPAAITVLMRNNHWSKSIGKIVDWLSLLKWSNYLSQNDEYYIQAAFCSLRSSSTFQKSTVWTEIVPRAILHF